MPSDSCRINVAACSGVWTGFPFGVPEKRPEPDKPSWTEVFVHADWSDLFRVAYPHRAEEQLQTHVVAEMDALDQSLTFSIGRFSKTCPVLPATMVGNQGKPWQLEALGYVFHIFLVCRHVSLPATGSHVFALWESETA